MEIRNFLSFGRAVVRLAKRGLVLIEGENRDDPTARSNGAAKSAIVEAFVWCMQGITLRGYSGDDVINRKVGKNCVVSIVWKDRGTRWKVVRSRQDAKLKTSLNLYQNGERVTGSTVADTQAMLDQLLGMTAKTFLSSVVFGQTNAYRFSSLTDTEQKAILDEALGIEAYATAGAAARERVNLHTVNLATIARDDDTLGEEIEAYEEEIRSFTKKDGRFESDREERLAALREERAELKTKLSAVVVRDLASLQKSRLLQRGYISKHNKEEREVRDALARQKTVVALSEKEVDTITHKIEQHQHLSGSCPTCGEAVDFAHQTTILKTLRKELKLAQNTVEVDNIFLKKTEEHLHNMQRGGKNLEDVLIEIESQIDEAVKTEAKVNAWSVQITKLGERIAEVKDEKNPYRALLKEKQKRLEDANEERRKLRADMAEEERKLELYQFWHEAFGAKGLRSLLIDTALPILNEKVERYTQAITEGNIRIEFKTQSEQKSGKVVDKFEVAVTNTYGAGSYKGNSAGEKAKVDLCVGLALQALVASRARSAINVAFFDEPFESLDDAAIERVAVLLTEELHDRESVFVITHNEALKAFFPNVVTVIKEGGMSHVE